jgi:hypothetical protein
MKNVKKRGQPGKRKTYSAPKLTTHGDIAKLTKQQVPNGFPSGIIVIK